MDRSAALLASRATNWEKRAAAAGELARFEDVEALEALAALLNDTDLAVIKRSVAALLANSSRASLLLLLDAYPTSDNQVGDVMNDELRVAVAEHPDLRGQLRALSDEGNFGARLATTWLG